MSTLRLYLLAITVNAYVVSPLSSVAAPAGWVVGWGQDVAGAATASTTPRDSATEYATGLVMIGERPLSNVVAIAAGTSHSLALTADGVVFGWGSNGAGEAIGSPASAYGAAGRVELWGQPLEDIKAISASRSESTGFSLALRRNGTVLGWGDDRRGQIAVPQGLSDAVAISAGCFQSLALRSDGTIASWGGGSPPPPGLSNVTAIAAGQMYYQNLALTRDGHVIDWPIRAARYDLATAPADLTNALAVSAGWNHKLALRRDGTVVGWGFNNGGQATGLASTPPQQQVTGTVTVAGQILSNVTAVAAGNEYSLALKADGTVVTWGWAHLIPIAPPAGLSNVVAISASGGFCLAITTNPAVAARFKPVTARGPR